jgi:HK97 family phage major capsid protein
MTTTEIKARIDKLGNAWEQFKTVNDRRLAEVERKGVSDPLTENHLGNISAKLDEYKDRLGKMEASFRRPSFGDGSNLVLEDDLRSAHKNAFCNYLRKGMEGDLCNLQTKSLSVASDPDGGYLVSPQLSENIIRTVFETSPMRQLASVEIISSDSLEILEDKDEAVAGWTTESASVSDTATPQIGKKTINVHELYAQPKATQKLIDDSAIDIEAWLAAKIADIFGRKENTAFISGDGVGKPRGILTYTAGTDWGQIEQVASGSSGAVTADKLVELFYSLKEGHATRAAFLMNRSTIDAVRKLKDSTNQYVWNPGLAAGAPDTLLGVPVHQAADMPVPSSNSLSIAVGDFKSAYQIVDRAGIRVLRDPFTDKPFVKFYTTKRVGGDVVNFDAIKIMKLGS